MSDLDDIISGSITAASSTPTRQGFGKPCFMVYHDENMDLWRDYGSLPDLVTDGHDSKSVAYRMAQAAFSQTPRPKTVRIGRITTAVSHHFSIVITDATEGNHIKLTVTGPDGTVTAIDYTIGATETTTTVATAVELLIEAVTGLSSTSSTATISVTGDNAGDRFYISGLQGCTYLDTTGDASIDDDLTAILEDNEDFYGVAISVESAANVEAVAAWTEANHRFFVAHSQDTIEATSSAVLGPALATAAYSKTFPLYSLDSIHWPAAAMLGRALPKNPGSFDFALKTLTGVTPDKLSGTQKTQLKAKGWNFYIAISGRSVTNNVGKVASGQYADVIIGIDWMESEIKANVFNLLSSNDKTDYDDAGISMVCGTIRGVLDQAKSDARKILDPGNGDDVLPPFVEQPKVSDIDPADRADRLLPDIKFGGRLRGGIHAVTYQGTLSI